MPQSNEEPFSARFRAMWSNGRGALRNYSEFTLIGTLVVLVIVGVTALRTPSTVVKAIEVSSPADLAKIKTLEADKVRFLAEIAEKGKKLKVADEQIDALQKEGEKSLTAIASLVEPDTIARHLLAAKRKSGGAAGFGPLYTRALWSIEESLGVGSWFRAQTLAAAKDIMFGNGAANLVWFQDNDLGRSVMLKVAASYKTEFALFLKYPKLLGDFDPESAVSTQTSGAPTITEQTERMAKYFDMKDATVEELADAQWFVEFLSRRYSERSDGAVVVSNILEMARKVLDTLVTDGTMKDGFVKEKTPDPAVYRRL